MGTLDPFWPPQLAYLSLTLFLIDQVFDIQQLVLLLLLPSILPNFQLLDSPIEPFLKAGLSQDIRPFG